MENGVAKMPQEKPTRYLSAEKLKQDDFGAPFTFSPGEMVYDAKTMNGSWATMNHANYLLLGHPGGLGVGKGQAYERQANGELHKVAG